MVPSIVAARAARGSTDTTRCVITNHSGSRGNRFRDVSLQTKKGQDDESNQQEDDDDNNNNTQPTQQQQQQPQQPSTTPTPPNRGIIDIIIESPLFTSFLFWAPFIFNPKLRLRFTNFLSKYLDLSIAVPVFGVGTIVAVLYVSYQNQLVDIGLASETTEESLRVVREIRRAQMTGGARRNIDNNGDDGAVSIEKEYEMALENYGYALGEELQLRNTFLTLPVKIPNAPEGPDRAAAKQFLGMEIDENE